MDTDVQPQEGQIRPGVLAGGAMLLALGGMLLLDTTGLVDVPLHKLVGPICLITLGVLMMVGKGGVVCGYRERGADGRPPRVRPRGGTVGGVWLIGIGVWLWIAQTNAFGLDFHNSWPLFIIMSGLIMLIRGVR